MILEQTLGHLDLARQGLCLTLERLVNDGWATPAEAFALAKRLCFENQEDVFPVLSESSSLSNFRKHLNKSTQAT
jgi:hypothetical protein